MIDIENIKKSIPDESLIKEIIESDTLSILISDSYEIDDIDTIIEALVTFSSRTDFDYRIVILGDKISDQSFKSLIKVYGISDKADAISNIDDSGILSNYLCGSVLLTRETDSDYVKLAKEFYIPVISTNKDCERVFFDENERVLFIDETSAGIAAALVLINEKKYRDLLSGFHLSRRKEE